MAGVSQSINQSINQSIRATVTYGGIAYSSSIIFDSTDTPPRQRLAFAAEGGGIRQLMSAVL